MESKNNDKTSVPKLWDTTKVNLRGPVTAIQASSKSKNNLPSHHLTQRDLA